MYQLFLLYTSGSHAAFCTKSYEHSSVLMGEIVLNVTKGDAAKFCHCFSAV